MGVKCMAIGLNQSEANHDGVSVEEMPSGERAKHGRSGGLAHETYAEYDLNKSKTLLVNKWLSVANDIIDILLLLVSLASVAEWKVEV